MKYKKFGGFKHRQIRIKKVVTRVLGSIVLGTIVAVVILSLFSKIDGVTVLVTIAFLIHCIIMIALITNDKKQIQRPHSTTINTHTLGWILASAVMCALSVSLLGVFVFSNTEQEKNIFSSLIGLFSYTTTMLVLLFDQGFTRRETYDVATVSKVLGWIMITMFIIIVAIWLIPSATSLIHENIDHVSKTVDFGNTRGFPIIILGGTIFTIIWGFAMLYQDDSWKREPSLGAGP